uniref:Uncharacterized protein n=1 Tax=Anguilla anguilla TaxID=7936 RepID=A0A0E9PR09_ANGAN
MYMSTVRCDLCQFIKPIYQLPLCYPTPCKCLLIRFFACAAVSDLIVASRSTGFPQPSFLYIKPVLTWLFCHGAVLVMPSY